MTNKRMFHRKLKVSKTYFKKTQTYFITGNDQNLNCSKIEKTRGPQISAEKQFLEIKMQAKWLKNERE